MSKQMNRIAAYWDFENIHAAAVNAEHGEGAYSQMHGDQPCILKVDPIVEHMRSIGDIVVHRAYGNWHNLWRYQRALQHHSIDLVQMFPRTEKAKNGADIRMALEVIDANGKGNGKGVANGKERKRGTEKGNEKGNERKRTENGSGVDSHRCNTGAVAQVMRRRRHNYGTPRGPSIRA